MCLTYFDAFNQIPTIMKQLVYGLTQVVAKILLGVQFWCCFSLNLFNTKIFQKKNLKEKKRLVNFLNQKIIHSPLTVNLTVYTSDRNMASMEWPCQWTSPIPDSFDGPNL